MPLPVVSQEVYVERQSPPFGVWLLAPFAGLLTALVVLPLSLAAAVALFAVVSVTIALLLLRSSSRIVVTDGTDPGLRAGPAYLEAWHIGDVVPLDRDQTRDVLGPGANALAYLAHRGWISTAVRVEVRDVEDPTPYWVVSTRRPLELASALDAVRPPLAD
ncbi:hypothetical protein EDD28_3092 [Salana multivorans]|uniref:DUF3093 family protein n=1 Tax=Salana multivorans TaxID=120377 RepID=A0A3N2D1K8_9MICO|nr:DUF3093 domain-containing protein [Salana multivorans]ROR93670.1 hypothetical protein EDD28_3092 [Salana multivorans]